MRLPLAQQPLPPDRHLFRYHGRLQNLEQPPSIPRSQSNNFPPPPQLEARISKDQKISPVFFISSLDSSKLLDLQPAAPSPLSGLKLHLLKPTQQAPLRTGLRICLSSLPFFGSQYRPQCRSPRYWDMFPSYPVKGFFPFVLNLLLPPSFIAALVFHLSLRLTNS